MRLKILRNIFSIPNTAVKGQGSVAFYVGSPVDSYSYLYDIVNQVR